MLCGRRIGACAAISRRPCWRGLLGSRLDLRRRGGGREDITDRWSCRRSLCRCLIIINFWRFWRRRLSGRFLLLFLRIFWWFCFSGRNTKYFRGGSLWWNPKRSVRWLRVRRRRRRDTYPSSWNFKWWCRNPGWLYLSYRRRGLFYCRRHTWIWGSKRVYFYFWCVMRGAVPILVGTSWYSLGISSWCVSVSWGASLFPVWFFILFSFGAFPRRWSSFCVIFFSWSRGCRRWDFRKNLNFWSPCWCLSSGTCRKRPVLRCCSRSSREVTVWVEGTPWSRTSGWN